MSKGWFILFTTMVLSITACDEQPPRFITREKADPNVNGSDAANDGDDVNGSDNMKEGSQEEFSFDSHVVQQDKVVSDLNSKTIQSGIELQREKIAKKKEFKQVQRERFSDIYYQGFSGDAAVEEFEQGVAKALDVVVVVDNSSSMKEEQRNLATKLKPLLSYLGNSDWQIGVVTTDADRCNFSLIQPSDPDQETKFANAVNVGTDGSNNEQGILAARRALEGQCFTGNWLREQSTLAVLIVSDEDNCSDGEGCKGKPYAKASYLTDYLASMREVGVNARVYGIFWHPSMDQSECATGERRAPIYSELVDATSGHWGSVCDADYSDTLSRISSDIGVILSRKFTLRDTPDIGTLKVIVDGKEISTGYTVTGRVVSFSEAPKAGSRVRFSYRYNGQEMKVRFALTNAFDPKSLTVSVDDAIVKPGLYQVDPMAKQVVFANMPKPRAKIKIDYREDKPLSTQFSLGDKPYRNSLKVTVNGVATTKFTVDAQNRILFSEAPTDGAEISAAYAVGGTAITKYPLNVTPGTEDSLRVYDSTGAEVDFAYTTGWVTIADHEFQDGRKITIEFDNINRDDLVVTLPHTPLAGNVVISDGQNTICENSQVVDKSTLIIQNCAFDENLKQIHVAYDYESILTEFELRSAKLQDPEAAQWHVFVDGVETDKYERVAWKVILTETPTKPSVILIRLSWGSEAL
ncbi:MAG: hypothetical protein AB7T49_11535 [Oligoflexales bacterium]